jgi:hypothetical protein
MISSSPVRGDLSRPDRRGGEVLREIDDPHNGDRWLLTRNADNPAGPGMLVRVSGARLGPQRAGLSEDSQAAAPALPVIRAGDRLIVEEDTPVVSARLQATAMNPAAAGSVLNVRLAIGGRVMRAVALAPGRAALEPETGR